LQTFGIQYEVGVKKKMTQLQYNLS